jgi:hypothetical protein
MTNQRDRQQIRKSEGNPSKFRLRIPFWMCCLAVTAMLTACDNSKKDFQRAEQVNTETAYAEFIKQHPRSPLVAQAQTNMEKIVAADRSLVDELSLKQVPVTMQTHLGSRPGEPLISMREEPDEAAAAKLEADRRTAGAKLTADMEVSHNVEDFLRQHGGHE